MNYRNKLFPTTMLQYHLLLLLIVALVFSNCGSSKHAGGAAQSQSNYNARRLLLRDEGKSQLSYIDLANPDKNWYEPVPAGRDIQLVGNGRVLIGTGNGYEEREIATGKKIVELTTFPALLQQDVYEMGTHC